MNRESITSHVVDDGGERRGSTRLERFVRTLESHPMITLMVWGIVLLLPMLVTGASLTAHDVFHHIQWIDQFGNQLLAGELYPRWITRANGGLGSPAFFYYFPLPYYISSLFIWLKPVDPLVIYRFAATAAVMLILCGLTMRLWLAGRFSKRTALFGAMIAMALPFHLVVELYIRMALSQYCAAIFLPLILLGIDMMMRRSRYGFLLLAAAMAGLMLSHLPTTMLFAAIPPIYAFAIGKGRDRWMLPVKTILGMGFGAALAGIYLIPFFSLRGIMNFGVATVGKLDYRVNFLFTSHLFKIEYFSFLGWVALTWSVLALLWLRRYRQEMMHDRERTRFLLFCSGLIVATLFMMSTLSLPIWDALPLLQSVQFAQRFLPILTLALAPLLAHAMSVSLSRYGERKRTGRVRGAASFIQPVVLAATLLLTAIFSVKYIYGFYWNVFDHRNSPGKQEQFRLAIDPPEYLTKWSDLLRANEGAAIEPFVKGVAASTQRWRSVGNDSTTRMPRSITNVVESSRVIRFTSVSDEPYTIDFLRFYFPGLIGRADSGTMRVSPSPGYGLIRLDVPAGERTITVELAPTPAETYGRWCSAIALLVAIGLGLWQWKRQPQRS